MNINVNFGEILTKAWQITWKFKVLWIFGILAGCGQNNGGRFNNSFNWRSDQGEMPQFFRQFENMQPPAALRAMFDQYLGLIAVVIVLLCVLWFLFYFLGIMGKTGLIKGASKADGGAESMSFGEIWSESLPYFWRMFGLNLLVGLPFFLVIVVLVGGVLFAGISMSQNPSSGGVVAGFVGMMGIFLTAVCCIAIVAIVVGMIVEQAQNALVLEDLGVLASLGRGWEVFKRNVLTIIVMVIILGVLGFVISLIISLPLLIIVLPAVAGIAIAGTNSLRTALAPLIMAGVCCAVYLPVLWVLGGILQTYTQSAWTLTYRRMVAPPATPALPVLPAQPTDAQ